MESRAVVVVHGIGDGTGADRSEFSSALRNNVLKEFSPNASLVWEEANWEVLNDAIDLVASRVIKDNCDRYINEVVAELEKQEADENRWGKCWLLKVLGSCLSKVGGGALSFQLKTLEFIRKYAPGIVDAAIDLPLYMQQPRGDEIRAVVRDASSKATLRADKVILVGHSLGSVVAFDVAVEELSGCQQSRLAALVTMGSPLEWVTDIRRKGANSHECMTRIEPIPWINFWDPEDPVPERKALDEKVFPDVCNREVKSGKKLISAHCAYWNDVSIAKTISILIKEKSNED